MHIEIPDKKGLREFGLIMGGMFVGMFGLFLPWLFALRFSLMALDCGGRTLGIGVIDTQSFKIYLSRLDVYRFNIRVDKYAPSSGYRVLLDY